MPIFRQVFTAGTQDMLRMPVIHETQGDEL